MEIAPPLLRLPEDEVPAVLHVPARIEGELPRLAVPNPLLDTQTYTKVGKNKHFEVRPSAVHFKIFKLEERIHQVVRVVNISGQARRVHVLQPQTPFFRAMYTKEKFIVPGMSVDIRIVFSPDEFRYYRDALCLHCEDDNILVPLHAYPVMNEHIFPSRIDFGACPISKRCVKIVPLICKVPMDFEYEVVVVEGNTAFEVFPLQGVVPGHGSVDITIAYTPTQYTTSVARVQVNVAHAMMRPVGCVITGCCSPGIARDAILQKGARPSTKAGSMSLTRRAVARSLKPRGAQRRPRQRTKKTGESSSEEEIDGILVPKKRTGGHKEVAYILNQQRGKLKLRHLKKAISKKRTQAREMQERTVEGSDFSHFEGDSRQVKEVLFRQLLQTFVSRERDKELKWFVSVGESTMTNDARDAVRAQRHKTAEESARNMLEEDTHRRVVEFSKEHVVHELNSTGEHVPDFDEYRNSEWVSRQRALVRLQQAGRLMIIRRRARSRLQCLQAFIDDAGSSKARVRALVEDQQDSNAVKQVSTREGEDTELPFPLSEQTLHWTAFPQVRRGTNMLDDLQPVPVTIQRGLVDCDLLPLKVPLYYTQMRYTHVGLPALPSWMPPETKRSLRTGAEEEEVLDPRQASMEAEDFFLPDDMHKDTLSIQSLAPGSLNIWSPNGHHPVACGGPLSELDDGYLFQPLRPLASPTSAGAVPCPRSLAEVAVDGGTMTTPTLPRTVTQLYKPRRQANGVLASFELLCPPPLAAGPQAFSDVDKEPAREDSESDVTSVHGGVEEDAIRVSMDTVQELFHVPTKHGGGRVASTAEAEREISALHEAALEANSSRLTVKMEALKRAMIGGGEAPLSSVPPM